MALVNVKKKVDKARGKLGLHPGEEVLGGCTTNPSGTMRRMLARELGGAVAAAVRTTSRRTVAVRPRSLRGRASFASPISG